MTKVKAIQLIASAAIEQREAGDCKGMYEEDMLEHHAMTSEQMKDFLKEHSVVIDVVEEDLFNHVLKLTENHYNNWKDRVE